MADRWLFQRQAKQRRKREVAQAEQTRATREQLDKAATDLLRREDARRRKASSRADRARRAYVPDVFSFVEKYHPGAYAAWIRDVGASVPLDDITIGVSGPKHCSAVAIDRRCYYAVVPDCRCHTTSHADPVWRPFKHKPWFGREPHPCVRCGRAQVESPLRSARCRECEIDSFLPTEAVDEHW